MVLVGERSVPVPPPAGVEPVRYPVDEAPPLPGGQVGVGGGERFKREDVAEVEPEGAVRVGLKRGRRVDGIIPEPPGERRHGLRVVAEHAVVRGVAGTPAVVILDVEPVGRFTDSGRREDGGRLIEPGPGDQRPGLCRRREA